MKIIDKYIFKELLISFILGLFVFTSILLLNSTFQLIDILLSRNVSIITISKLLFYLSLSLLSLSIPISLLFAILTAYSKFSYANEITVLRSSGINTLYFIWQPLLLGLIFCIISCYLNLFAIPKIQNNFHMIYNDILHQQSTIKFDDKTFIELGNYKIYVTKVSKKNNKIFGINIYKLGTTFSTRIFAKSGTVKYIIGKGLVFVLNNGIIQNTGSADEFTKLTQFSFKTYKVNIPLSTNITPRTTKTLQEFTIKELKEEIKASRSKNLPTTYLETEYYFRWVLSFAVLVFTILGIPLGIRLQRSSKSIGAGVTIIVVTIYYFLLIASVVLSEKGTLPSKYIMWLSDATLFITGIILNIRLLCK